ncbi:MAG: hypothetical protein JXQ30_01880 [Spirochaetes bacterium]|nr:hypothetical protein [Spirochaetota bacterium]
MTFTDTAVREIIEKLQDHYHTFYGNQFIRYYLLDSRIPRSIWLDIETLLDSEREFDGLKDVYERILSFTSFVSDIKNTILPKMMEDSRSRLQKMSPDSRILFKMTLSNLNENIRIFKEIIGELLSNVKRVDAATHTEGKAVYARLSYVSEIDEKLRL